MPDDNVTEKTKKCFIVSAIGDTDSEPRIHGEWFLEGIVYPAFERFQHYEIKRSDLIRVPGMIDGQIINHLMDDDLVIADMTFLNANVFYEIGIRHLAQKPIIHMYRRDVSFKIPFDVHAFRAIEFETSRAPQIRAAKEALIEYITATEEPGFQVENPVTRARGAQRLEENATPAQRIMMDRLEALEARQSRFESDPLGILTNREKGLTAKELAEATNDAQFPTTVSISISPNITNRELELITSKIHRTNREIYGRSYESFATSDEIVFIFSTTLTPEDQKRLEFSYRKIIGSGKIEFKPLPF